MKNSPSHTHQPAPTAQELHAQALALSDDPEQAVDLLAEARRLDPSSGPIALDRGVRLLEFCRYGEAEAELREASLLLPESPWPHYNLGWIYQELGDYENAAWEYETALDLAPHSPDILENLLLAYTRLGTKPKRRIELIDRALRADPDPDWQRWLRLQRALLQGVAKAENNMQDLNEGVPENESRP